jgi:cellulose synthase/poly-beta-1,6-N-acetylglucosamine synthase-like glycosyltransferase
MITVGIPTYNEGGVIGKSILSALEQVSPRDEIVVVASGCTDNTYDVVRSISKKYKQVKLITEPTRRGKASALNIILKRAKGDIIVQTDGDVVLEKNSIRELVKHFKDPDVGAVSAQPLPVLPKNNLFYDWTIMSYKKMHERRLKESRGGNFWHVTGYLCAYRKEAMGEIPLDMKGAVDSVMGIIVRNKGYNIVYEPTALVYVKAPLTVRDFVKQRARIRAGYYQVKEKFEMQPRKFANEFVYLPKEMLVRAKSPRKFFSFIFIGLVYFYSWLYGWWLIKTKKPLGTIWKRVDSTK